MQLEAAEYAAIEQAVGQEAVAQAVQAQPGNGVAEMAAQVRHLVCYHSMVGNHALLPSCNPEKHGAGAAQLSMCVFVYPYLCVSLCVCACACVSMRVYVSRHYPA
jgi:hypothetical protein